MGEFVTLCYFDKAFEKRLKRAVRSGSEAKREGVEQCDEVEFALSLHEIRCASPLAQLIGGKRSLNPLNHD